MIKLSNLFSKSNDNKIDSKESTSSSTSSSTNSSVQFIHPRVSCICGTEEDWKKNRHKHPGLHEIIPAKVYISEDRGKLCLVTSKEWSDWLHHETHEIPSKPIGIDFQDVTIDDGK